MSEALTSTLDNGLRARRRAIVCAARDLLDENGLDGLTIRAVLARTGLARRAFYECFAGKDDLVLGMFEETLLDAANHYRSIAGEGNDPLSGLEMLLKAIVLGRYGPQNALGAHQADSSGESIDRRSAALSREHLRLAESRPADLQAALSPLLGLIATLVTDGIRAGQLRASDPDLQAQLLYNLVSTTVHTELLTNRDPGEAAHSRHELADNIWEFCRRAISA